ncbi:hypothetical protein [Kibdelosporangium philippinense]|uniref:hypothetical protein n=1 Tax=Kibdelosporangium philippinense TaxID=211113 RepID=UPI003606BE79
MTGKSLIGAPPKLLADHQRRSISLISASPNDRPAGRRDAAYDERGDRIEV